MRLGEFAIRKFGRKVSRKADKNAKNTEKKGKSLRGLSGRGLSGGWGP